MGYSSSFTRGARQDTRKLVTSAMMLHENLWRFVVSITFHTIWLERLNRIGDPTMSEESHHAVAHSRLRRALLCFRNSTYQPGGGKWEYVLARVPLALADKLLQHIEPPLLLPPALPTSSTDLFLLFFDGCSRGNPGPGGSGSVIVRAQPQTHAATFVWMASISLSADDDKHFCRIYRSCSWTTAGETQQISTVARHRGQRTGNQSTPG